MIKAVAEARSAFGIGDADFGCVRLARAYLRILEGRAPPHGPERTATMIDVQRAARDGRGRFQPGQSGNPAGKQPGTLNHATRFRQLRADGDSEAAGRLIIARARDGNLAAPAPVPTHAPASVPESVRAGVRARVRPRRGAVPRSGVGPAFALHLAVRRHRSGLADRGGSRLAKLGGSAGADRRVACIRPASVDRVAASRRAIGAGVAGGVTRRACRAARRDYFFFGGAGPS
jgi:hypothetical protein